MRHTRRDTHTHVKASARTRREGRTAESVHGDRIKAGAKKVYLADPHAVLALEGQLEASVLEWGEHLGPRRPLNQ